MRCARQPGVAKTSKVKKTLNKTPSTEKVSKPAKGKLRENIEALVIAIILALFIRAFVVQAFKIPSGSMENTLLIGDYILVNKFIYGIKLPFGDITVLPIKEPKRNDIIVFKYPGDASKDYIKRVVGIGGDSVEIRDKKVYVNNQLQESSFAKFTDPRIFSDAGLIPENLLQRDNYGPETVPKNKLFVMGDNRDSSNDSRFWGYVDKSAVKGRAFIIYWSWNKDKKFGVRWDRLGDLIH